ncbi:MAG: Gfo/Idh/MocA family oxidoreductase [Actinomycetota bacterium]|nr:Gfo/Idh/MocA family oxidoreductase [Actinomycetota bacterium]
MTLDRPHRAALIGLGKQAREDYIPGFASARHVDLVAVCDPNPAARDDAAARLDVPGYASHVDLLEGEALDFVVIAAPHHVHGRIVEDAAAASVNVLKEKPFAMCCDEALRLAEVAYCAGIEIMTTLPRRFNPIYTAYFEFADEIGEPFFVYARYTMYVETPHAGWRGHRCHAGGGCVIDMGYHVLDLLIWYFGLPDAVAATMSAEAIRSDPYDAEDTASLLLQWKSGLHGTCLLSRYLPPKTESLVVVGTEGIIDLRRGMLRRLESNGEISECLSRESTRNTVASSQLDYFSRVLAGARPNIGSPRYHVQHAALIDACYESTRTGTFVNPRELLEPTQATHRGEMPTA